ncbi:GNAT family N-acetyltransferase [Rhodoplanes roseus]|uniref:BioF2-like acetyltransferase domain-containing protein n=1 Tax=Rhodoplanes roseus TaxID=29409 RepID=A0A327KLZ2_9BRAD|nr:GNAT family N-acetyltransferase [Rhodoplanes roseus]RAI39517.1 hypothetical protein CH341_25660 [Rhodoplanes roseus]
MEPDVASTYQTAWLSLAKLAAIRDEWSALAARAVAPNVFYTPAVALAAAPLYGRGVGAVLVRAADGRLVGLFPLRRSRRRYGLPLPVVTGWTHPFAPLGTPLLDPADPAGIVAAALEHLAAERPAALLLPYLPAEGPVALAVDAAVARFGSRQAAFDRHGRAELLRPSGPSGPPPVVDGRAKEHARQRRRLGERGRVVFDLARGPAAVPALSDFFLLEVRGWKGEAGTAALGRPAEQALMTGAVAGLAQAGAGSDAMVARLLLDGQPIAAGIVITSGRGAWFWKTAYDETLAKFSPGVLLALDLSAALLRDAGIAFVDSCAVAGHPMIDRLWPARRVLADRLIGFSPAGFAAARQLEALRRHALATAKRLRDRMRR